MYWNLNVVADGSYKVSLKYACPDSSVGVPITIQANNERLDSSIRKAFSSKFIDDYEQVARIVEADEQTWATQELGNITLNKGAQQLKLYAGSQQSSSLADIKAIILEKWNNH